MRPPADEEIYAPEFPPKLDWFNVALLRMDRQVGHPVMVEFFDTARVNSLRTLPYLKAWHERYHESGLRVIGVHTPGYSFGRDDDLVRAELERLEIPYAVALDPDYKTWLTYGNRGWPARYLFDRKATLRYFHYGEGDYLDAEVAIQELLIECDPDLELPAPMDPLRPEDAPDAQMEAQTADVNLPADAERLELSGHWSEGEDYLEAAEAGATASVSYRAGAAYAVLSGTVAPGLHETTGTVAADAPGLRLHGFQFTPLAPL